MEKSQLELTVKALIIGVILCVVFCGANVYLGLKIGNTISASIPAAILAMGLLRMFKKYSTLENSISQTTASTGESIAVVVVFVFPALLILKIWTQFDYLNIIMVGIPGTLIGVIYSTILRKVLLNDKSLTFPEGQAIGKVLLNTETAEASSVKPLVIGVAISSILNLCQVGFKVLSGGVTRVAMVGSGLVGGGVSFSAAILGAGYLVGFMQMFVSFLALLFAWLVLLPIFASAHGIPNPNDLMDSAFAIWSKYIRPIGIGVMLFSGFATILMLLKPIVRGMRESVAALKGLTIINAKDQDINIVKLLVLLALASIPLLLLILNKLPDLNNYYMVVNIAIAVGVTVVTLLLGFLVAAVAGYFAGFIGSTNSPVSGLLFIGVIVMSLIVRMVTTFATSSVWGHMLLTTSLLVAFIGFTACVSNGSVQDFKSGQIVGATPYKQQIGLFIGVIVAVLVAPLMINLIFNAYGIAGVVPRAGMDVNATLSAPQASAVAALAKNILGGSQDWSLIGYGVVLGAIALVIDTVGKLLGKFRCPILSIGVGIYLPPDLITTLFIGGLLRLLVDRRQKKIREQQGNACASVLQDKSNLLVCGLVAGESVMGLLLAIPFVLKQSSDALKLVGDNFVGISQVLSAIVTILLLTFIYRYSTKKA